MSVAAESGAEWLWKKRFVVGFVVALLQILGSVSSTTEEIPRDGDGRQFLSYTSSKHGCQAEDMTKVSRNFSFQRKDEASTSQR